MKTMSTTIAGVFWTVSGIIIIAGALYWSQLPCVGCSGIALQGWQQSITIMGTIGLISIILGVLMIIFRRKISRK